MPRPAAPGRRRAFHRGAGPGAYAEYARVSPHAPFRIPDHVSYRAAALTEPFAVGMHAARRARVGAGDLCLIMGGGPVGVFTLLAARRLGAGPIVVSDFAPGRRDLCERLGADVVVDPAETDPGVVGQEMTGAPPAVVFDAVGTPPTLQEATRLAGTEGRVGVVRGGERRMPHGGTDQRRSPSLARYTNTASPNASKTAPGPPATANRTGRASLSTPAANGNAMNQLPTPTKYPAAVRPATVRCAALPIGPRKTTIATTATTAGRIQTNRTTTSAKSA